MNEKGFTLIEALVALVILLFGVLATTQMSIIYVQANTYNNQSSEATILAQEKMEELRSYARSDRNDRHSAFDFDYLVSTDATFSSLNDPAAPTVPVAVPGLLSGAGGCAGGKWPWNTDPDPLAYDYWQLAPTTDTPQFGAMVYGCEEKLTVTGTTSNRVINRRWTVEPLPRVDDLGNVVLDEDNVTPIYDYAILFVETSWTDRYGKVHDISFTSLVGRKQ